MKISIRRSKDVQTFMALHSLVLPHDEKPVPTPSTQLWVGYSTKGTPVAFCSARKLTWENAVFLERAGVLSGYGGLGLQRRMIRLRERWAAEIGATTLLTYTTLKNYGSMVNLLRCGYRFYSPQTPWAGRDVHYYRKDL